MSIANIYYVCMYQYNLHVNIRPQQYVCVSVFVYIVPYLEGYEVFATSESNNLLLAPNSKVQLYWLPSAVVSPLAVDGGNETLTVDIKMARLDLSTNQWINSATLETSISNSGNVTISIPDLLESNEIGVYPVVFDISPSRTEGTGLGDIAKISSTVFYMQVRVKLTL